MSMVKRISLLTLPSETRLDIFRYLFEDLQLDLLLSTTTTEAKVREDTIRPYSKTAVDDGITLTCRILRAEAMPELRRTLNLWCYIGSGFHGPGRFPIKPFYASSIKKGHIEFGTDMWTVSFKNLPSLEVVVIESGDECETIDLGEAYLDTFKEWAEADDMGSFIKVVKLEARYTTGDWGADDVLDNKDRGFRILWKDKVRSVNREDYIALMFDWDTLEVLEGADEIEYDFRRMLDDDEEEDGCDCDGCA